MNVLAVMARSSAGGPVAEIARTFGVDWPHLVAQATTLRLEIVTPEATVYSDDVHMVTLPAIDGQIGIFHVTSPS